MCDDFVGLLWQSLGLCT